MNATIYWTRHRLRQRRSELSWTLRLWWLKQEIDFLGWRWRMESRLPETTVSTSARLATEGGSHALPPLPMLHG